jgi:hypothetical protein
MAQKKSLLIWHIFTYFFVIWHAQYTNSTSFHPSSAKIATFSVISTLTNCCVPISLSIGRSLTEKEFDPLQFALVSTKGSPASLDEAIFSHNPLQLILTSFTMLLDCCYDCWKIVVQAYIYTDRPASAKIRKEEGAYTKAWSLKGNAGEMLLWFLQISKPFLGHGIEYPLVVMDSSY